MLVNSVQRRLVLEQEDRLEDFVRALHGIPAEGFHTYGESWLRHLDHTLTGIVLGRVDGGPTRRPPGGTQ